MDLFPLSDENPTVRASLVTSLIVAVNAAVWVFVQHLGADPHLSQSIWRFGAIPGELLGRVTPGMRITDGKTLLAVLDGISDWRTEVTSMFMHADWMHIIGNMWFLLQLASGLLPPGAGGVGIWAHAGGFTAGFLLVELFTTRSRISAIRLRREPARSIVY